MTLYDTKYARRPADYYPTPGKTAAHLLPHLAPGTKFAEICAGAGDLIRHLEAAGHRCVHARDIEPKANGILIGRAEDWTGTDMCITNPPWSFSRGEKLLPPIMDAHVGRVPMWLLLDAAMPMNGYFAPYAPFVGKIVPAGRPQWLEGTADDKGGRAKKDAAWIFFDTQHHDFLTARLNP